MSSQLRELTTLLGELDASIENALRQIRWARRVSEHTAGDVGLAWKKGLDDALLLLRPVEQAHERFQKWMRDAGDEVLKPDDRTELFGATS